MMGGEFLDKLLIGSLFSGIGGLELGLERSGLGSVLWQSEIDPFCKQILAKHWPEARQYGDVRNITAAGKIDLLCGGFPCQDLSGANRTASGLAGSRSGLWSEFRRIIALTSPDLVVIENIYHRWRRWIPVVREDLHKAGYESYPIRLRASDVGAPHARARGFVLAHSIGKDVRIQSRWSSRKNREEALLASLNGAARSVAGQSKRHWSSATRVRRTTDGISRRLDKNRLMALGNAVVPQVTEVLGIAIRNCFRKGMTI